MQRLPYGFARRHRIFLSMEGRDITAWHTRTTHFQALAEAQRVAGVRLKFASINDADFEELLSHHYANSGEAHEILQGKLAGDDDLLSLAEAMPDNTDLMEQEEEAPVIRFINAMLTEAINQGASDIHLETFETRLSIRFRVDGVLRDVIQPSHRIAPLLISRIKVMAKLDIAEKRLPQDGRINLRLAGREIDVRISTLPSNGGERVVLRLLHKNGQQLSFTELGMSEPLANGLAEILSKPHGILLVTGPTGSGKTTTLYAALQRLRSVAVNILTIEDPVEYDLDGIGQTQVNVKAGMTFAKGLRAILRQDPDVVMVGEIRDQETAQVAIQASLTGHLVLSTLHTNTAVGAITRLRDMGIEPFLISSSLIGVLSQRLMRRLCRECRSPRMAEASELILMGLPPTREVTLYEPVGCSTCNRQGYRGRTGIYELITVTDDLRTLIHDNAAEQAMLAEIRPQSPAIFSDGVNNVLAGTTSLSELLRVSRAL